jgi:hypothetical protein
MTNSIASGIPNFMPNFIANFLLSCKAHRMAHCMAPTTAYFMTTCTSNCLPLGLAHLPHAAQIAVKP